MRNDIETAAETRERRAALAGDVDFTMMYVAHDAFNRDLVSSPQPPRPATA